MIKNSQDMAIVIVALMFLSNVLIFVPYRILIKKHKKKIAKNYLQIFGPLIDFVIALVVIVYIIHK
ncbi:hypothetical protein [Lachnobacterium bovis]|uniref:hypothetical protein n=1 Tax=Lachnobacterium bovis TaxID=140626 RepID=UPI000480EA81|nr:hypothetical protein [Lachnobacterium bovis]